MLFMVITMSTIYVREQGATIRRKGERLLISKQGQMLDEIPLANVSQVVLMGNIQMTAQAAATLLDREVDVVFLSSYGKFRGRLMTAGSKHVRLRQLQLRQMSEESQALPLAKAIVEGKIYNQYALLQGQSERTHTPFLFQKEKKDILQMHQAVSQVSSLEVLRGYEGKAAASYFGAIRTLLHPDWKFERREYHPPPDPFNALISFLYSLVLKDVLMAVNLVGFDPYLGFFHEVDFGRPSLALDLMEEWRPIIADSLALQFIYHNQLKPASFQWTGRPQRPVELGAAGQKLVLQAYGQFLQTKLYHPQAGSGGETAIAQAIILQSRHLARVIGGIDGVYHAVKLKN